MSRALLLALILLISVPAQAAEAKFTGRHDREVAWASLFANLCQDKEESGVTTALRNGVTVITREALSVDEQNQCAYARAGLKNRCFERGDCPGYEDWLRAEHRPAGAPRIKVMP